MTRVYLPSAGPSDWQALLAEPEKHWKTGFSAKTLAHSWESASGLPREIAALFGGPAELLIALPEHKVPLPGGTRESQSDVFALIRHDEQTCAAMIEGKVNETFDKTLAEWFSNPSEGKQVRLRYICDLLGFNDHPPRHVRYQLLHRAASALIEARRFKTDEAAMIVHSFSPQRMWFEDFAAFADLLGFDATPDKPYVTTLKSGQRLRIGWATGNSAFLTA